MADKPWPLEKQRRSRIDWSGLVPADVVKSQIAWERGRTILAMFKAGYSTSNLAVIFGCGPHRAWQLLHKADRAQWRNKGLSPVEVYMGTKGDAAALSKSRRMPKTLNGMVRGSQPQRDWLVV